MDLLGIQKLFIWSIIIRLLVLGYGVVQDSISIVKYTDVDYYVFLDSLDYLWNKNESPYQRDTFRYTPLLSYMMLPTQLNVHLGKVVFVVFDLLTAFYLYKLLNKYYGKETKNARQNLVLIGTSLWLLNPMVVTISTRGNAESIMSFLIMWFLYLLDSEKFIQSGLVYGLSIHFKIYPIIYCVPVSVYFLFIAEGNKYKNIKSWMKFGTASILSLAGTTYVMFLKFGDAFLENTYFYHVLRSDHRHNFSVWNIILYMEQMPSLTKQHIQQSFIDTKKGNFSVLQNVIFDNKALSLFPQLFLCIIVPIILLFKKKQAANKNKRFIILIQVITIQTMLFVHFNKVITSQYFIWYLTFLPFFIEYIVKLFKENRSKLIKLIVVWVISQVIWLYFGFLLEFKNKNCFVGLFLASCIMLSGSVYVMGELLYSIG